MSAKLHTKPLCGLCEDGWITDAETGLPVERCVCRDAVPTAAQRRDRGIRLAESAHPGESKAARKIITDVAELHAEFSANDTRNAMNMAGIRSRNVIGGAFRWAKNEGLIEDTGRLTVSTDPGTHAHRITVWRSLIHESAKGVDA